MSDHITIGLVQMTSSNDVAGNTAVAQSLIEDAARAGAEFVLTPEMTGLMEIRREPLLEKIREEPNDLCLKMLRDSARTLGIWLLIGSLAIKIDDEWVANRSFLIDPDGEIRARYDKIHMFDVDLPDGESYRESKLYHAGTEPVVANLPSVKLGMTICYDLRFPYLFRAMALKGAGIIAVPSAFTKVTGEAHWHTLLQARAIETGSYILAPAQGGRHVMGRDTYGHSLVVDPWGRILADGGEKPGITIQRLDLKEVDRTRQKIPSLSHTKKLGS